MINMHKTHKLSKHALDTNKTNKFSKQTLDTNCKTKLIKALDTKNKHVLQIMLLIIPIELNKNINHAYKTCI